jgi:hypothetical protein
MPRSRRIRMELKHLDYAPSEIAAFDIDKVFVIDESREYELEIRCRLLTRRKSNELVPIAFRGITVKLRLAANTKSPANGSH